MKVRITDITIKIEEKVCIYRIFFIVLPMIGGGLRHFKEYKCMPQVVTKN